jgi:hypothetical protein
MRLRKAALKRSCRLGVLALIGVVAASGSSAAADAPVHGLWIWSSAKVLQGPQEAQAIRSFCASGGVTEIYVSVSSRYGPLEELQLTQLIGLMHESNVRVEALLSSTDADEPGAARTKLLDHVQSILQFNRQHAAARFDGIHLDIEPQQREENKGPGNLAFLPALIDTYRAVRRLTDRAGLSLNADIPNKFLKADLEQRRALLTSAPRFTLMLYELSSPEDTASSAQKLERLGEASQRFLQMAYAGLDDPKMARMAIALRTADYGPLLPQMLAGLDQVNRANPHYLGWARHSYNDTLAGVRISYAWPRRAWLP